MFSLLEQHDQAIAEICRRYNVARLEVFGSAATGDFREDASDIDLLVEFCPDTDLGPWMSRFFELRDALGEHLGRPVDLVMANAPRNPCFLREALELYFEPPTATIEPRITSIEVDVDAA